MCQSCFWQISVDLLYHILFFEDGSLVFLGFSLCDKVLTVLDNC